MKIRPVAVELIHVGGWTDMTRLTDTFCNFANAPKKSRKMSQDILKCHEIKTNRS